MTAPSQAVVRRLHIVGGNLRADPSGTLVAATDYDALTARVRELEAALEVVVEDAHEDHEGDSPMIEIPQRTLDRCIAALAKAAP